MVLAPGQRPGEIAGMHRDEIAGGTWTIPAIRRGNTQTSHTIHLTDTALEIIETAMHEIERLQLRRGEVWAGYIFEAVPGKPITNAVLCRAVDRQNKALGAKDVQPCGRWTPHDLRRTMRTGLSACKVRPDIAELTIGHTKRGIVVVFDQHGFEAERQDALEAWDRSVGDIITGEDTDTASVVSMSEALTNG